MRLVFINILFLIFFLLLGSTNSFGQNSQYQSAIQSADHYFSKGDYMNAKASYQYALRFKKADDYSKQRVDECIHLMRSQTDDRIRYSSFILKANNHYKKKEYTEALMAYKAALKLFSFEEYPQKQLIEINRIIKENAELSADYKEAIQTGDRFYNLGKFADARLEYQYALGLYPDQLHPKQRLEKIGLSLQNMSGKQKVYDKTIAKAENLFNQAEWKNALEAYQQANNLFPDEELPRRRIKELTPLLVQLEKYKSVIEAADEFYMVKDLANAKTKYEEALTLKPREIYPKEMIDKVTVAIQTKVTSELEDFNNAVKLGNQYISQQQWKDARSQFEFAKRLKPDETYPKEKLTQISKELRIEETAATLEASYEILINDADLFLAAKDYIKAKQSYTEASLLIPANSYPTEKIDEISETETRIASEKALLEKYQFTLRKAETLFQNKDYVSARLVFEQAQEFKPEEEYPKEKLSEINIILERISAQQTTEQNYQIAIRLADSYFNNEDYLSSQFEYQKARSLKNEDEYPQQQLLKIKNIFEQRAIALQKAYDKTIISADSLYAVNNYEEAKNRLEEAKKLKPEESYPNQKISAINAIITENYRKAKIDYDKFISEADRFYKAKVYERALTSYQEASKLLPEEIYPHDKIKEITDLFAAATIAIINETDITINNGEIKQLPFTPIPIKDRKLNYLYLVIKSSETEGNLRLIVNYGKDKTKNGGVIIRLASVQENNIHLVNVGTQYKWFSDDNNWISVQVEGGNVTIGLIKVSKGISP